MWGRILSQLLRFIGTNKRNSIIDVLLLLLVYLSVLNILLWFSGTSNVLCTLFLSLSNHNTIIQPVLQGNNLQLFK